MSCYVITFASSNYNHTRERVVHIQATNPITAWALFESLYPPRLFTARRICRSELLTPAAAGTRP